MIEKLDAIDGLTEILSADKVANLFFINDLALFGTGDVAVYRIGEGLIALNYRNDGLCLYAYGPYNEDEALTFLAREKWCTVMGPAATMDAFLPYFKDESSWSVLRRRMLSLEKAHFSPVARKGDRTEESVLRRLSTPDDFLQMLELYEKIEAFSHRRKTDRSELVEEAKELAQRDDGLYYATFIDGQAVSSAGLCMRLRRSLPCWRTASLGLVSTTSASGIQAPGRRPSTKGSASRSRHPSHRSHAFPGPCWIATRNRHLH